MQLKPIITAILVLLLLVAASGCMVNETTKNESGSNTGNSNVDVTINSNHTSQSTKTGYQYLVFDVTVKNLNEKDFAIGNPNYFKLTTADGSVYEYSYLSSLSNAISSVSHTNPGEKVTGAIAFEIPQNVQPTKLQYNDYSNQVVINLTSATSASIISLVPNVSSETEGNKTIFTSSRGYSITYPKTLKADYTTDPSLPLELYIYLSSSSSVNGVTVATKNLGAGETLEDFRSSGVNDLQKATTNFQQISNQATTLAGKPAYKIVWQATVPTQMSSASTQNLAIKSIQIYTINNGIGYVVAYKATQNNYDTYLVQAQQIIDSFKFIS